MPKKKNLENLDYSDAEIEEEVQVPNTSKKKNNRKSKKRNSDDCSDDRTRKSFCKSVV